MLVNFNCTPNIAQLMNHAFFLLGPPRILSFSICSWAYSTCPITYGSNHEIAQIPTRFLCQSCVISWFYMGISTLYGGRTLISNKSATNLSYQCPHPSKLTSTTTRTPRITIFTTDTTMFCFESLPE